MYWCNLLGIANPLHNLNFPVFSLNNKNQVRDLSITTCTSYNCETSTQVKSTHLAFLTRDPSLFLCKTNGSLLETTIMLPEDETTSITTMVFQVLEKSTATVVLFQISITNTGSSCKNRQCRTSDISIARFYVKLTSYLLRGDVLNSEWAKIDFTRHAKVIRLSLFMWSVIKFNVMLFYVQNNYVSSFLSRSIMPNEHGNVYWFFARCHLLPGVVNPEF